MKKNLRNFVAALMFIMPTILSTPTFAGENDPQAVVKFVGYKNALPVYCLNITNPANEKLTITVRDFEGIVLHEEIVSGNYISKNFLIDREDLGRNTIYFEVSKNADPVIAKIKVRGEYEK